MPAIQIEPEQLLHAALQMSRPEIEQFVRKLFSLKIREEAPGLSEREAELLMQINQGLPATMQERLNELIVKRRAENISAKELKELKKLTDQVEQLMCITTSRSQNPLQRQNKKCQPNSICVPHIP